MSKRIYWVIKHKIRPLKDGRHYVGRDLESYVMFNQAAVFRTCANAYGFCEPWEVVVPVVKHYSGRYKLL